MGVFLKTCVAAALGMALSNASAGGAGIEVQDPWIQAPPPGARVAAAYMTLKNSGDRPRVVVGASSSGFEQVELHRTVMHGTMAHMEPLRELAVAPRNAVVLKPGGLHLMLVNARKPLTAGGRVPLTLSFKDGGKLDFEAMVRTAKGGDAAEHKGHAH